GRLGPAPPAGRGGDRLGRRRARPTRGGAARNSPATPRPGGQGDRTSGRGEGRPGLEAGRGDPGRGGTGDPGCRRAAVRGSGHMEDANLNTTTPNLELAVEKVSKTRVKVTVRAGGEPMFVDTLNVSNAAARDKFVTAVTAKFPGIDPERLTTELLKVAA